MDGIMRDVTGIALAVIGLATLAVIVRQGSNAAQVIRESTTGFANVLSVAMGNRGAF